MPASFKVRTVYLDGDETKGTEEILDPDFGEAAIGRVAPVDSGRCLDVFDCIVEIILKSSKTTKTCKRL